MKKFLLFLTALSMALVLAACTAAPAETPDATEAPADAQEAAEPQTEADAAVAPDGVEQFLTVLVDAAVNYAPGTAGSSLTSAKYAAELMDAYKASGVDAEAIKSAVASFYGALDADTAKAFLDEKVGDLYGATKDLTADLLESAGYQPTAFPYAAEDITAVFTAIYEGLGQQLPA